MGDRSVTGARFAFDWRVYSLLLFGVLLITLGPRIVRAARAMAGDDPGARGALLRLGLIVLAITLPLTALPTSAALGWLLSGLVVLCGGVAAVASRPRAAAAGADAARDARAA